MPSVIYRPEKGTGFSNPKTRHFAGAGYRVVLKAGSNRLEADAIASLQSHPGIERFFDAGVIVVQDTSEPVNESAVGYIDLLELNVEQAEEVIFVETSVPLLEQWRDKDSRVTVTRAVTRRIEEIKEGRS